MLYMLCSYVHNELEVALVGTKVDLTYEYNVWFLHTFIK